MFYAENRYTVPGLVAIDTVHPTAPERLVVGGRALSAEDKTPVGRLRRGVAHSCDLLVFTGHGRAVAGQLLERARTFSDWSLCTAFWYENSNGLVEVAVNQGRADRELGLAIGNPVEFVLE